MPVTIAIHDNITAAFDGLAPFISCHGLHSLLVVFTAPSPVQMQALDLAVGQNVLYHLLNTNNAKKLVHQFYRVQSSLSNYPQLIRFVLFGLPFAVIAF